MCGCRLLFWVRRKSAHPTCAIKPHRCCKNCPDRSPLRRHRRMESKAVPSTFNLSDVSVFISNTNQEENQPAHLTLKCIDPAVSAQIKPLQPCRCVRIREERRQLRPPADQRAKLRALQDLRHHGPDAKHRLGHAQRRRCSQLHRHVRGAAQVEVFMSMASTN